MALFWPEGDKADAPKATAPRRGVIAITEAKRQRLTCQDCSLDRADLHHPKMPPTGAADPLIYIMGEAPGENEDKEGKQFVGKSGDYLQDHIPERWLSSIRWNNTIRCRPPHNRDPEGLEVECCRRLQIADIEASKPAVIIAAGRFPMQWFLGSDRAMGVWRGRRMPVKVGSHTAWLYPVEHPASILRRRNDKKMGEAIERTWERDMKRVFADIKNGLQEPYVPLPEEYKEGIICFEEYGKGGIARIEKELHALRDIDHTTDIETNRLRPYTDPSRILTVASGTFERTFAFPWMHPSARWTPQEQKSLKEIIEHYLMGTGIKWAHGAKFEQEWMYSLYGPKVVLDTQWGDSLGQAHILDERPDKALDDLTQLHFGFRIKPISDLDRERMESYSIAQILPYNGLDTKWTDALRHIQAEILEQDGLTATYEKLNIDTAGIVCMQAKGTVRSLHHITLLKKDMDQKVLDLNKQIMNHKDVLEFKGNGNKFIPTSNPNLVIFFRDFLGMKKPGEQRQGGAWHKSSNNKDEKDEGSWSVDEGVLAQFDHPVAGLILELRTTQKNMGYVTPLQEGGKYVHGDGLIHPSYSQYITVSGRQSCRDPNDQNYPIRKHKEIRRVVGCPPDHVFAAFDYKTLEWCIGAMLSQDENMGAEIWKGMDIHGDWTDMVGQEFVPKRVKENRKEVRQDIKQYWTFANLYGNTLSGVAYDLSNAFKVDVSPRRLEPFFNKFWGRYPKLQRYQQYLMDTYWKCGWVETGIGQRRHEPMLRNEIINHPFQGTAGHIVTAAETRLSRKAYKEERPGFQPIKNIHDDLSFYLHKKHAERDIEDIARVMCEPLYDFITVPLTVEVSVGDNWCDKEEVATFSTKDFQYE